MRLVGVGVGPGDPDLVTVKAVRMLTGADRVLVPVLAADETGRAEATVRRHVPGASIRRIVFALNEREDRQRRESAWDAAADAVVEEFAAGADTLAFATIGDPNVYSTFSYLAQTVRARLPEVLIETIPGITAMQDLAARSGTVLCEGTESLALFPMTAGLNGFRDALAAFDTVVAYKGGRHVPAMLQTLAATDRLADAVLGANLGLPGEQVLAAAEVPADAPAPYLSTLIVPARRLGRGARL